jgi:C4-type Zn-finger protein
MKEETKKNPYGLKFTLTIFDEDGNSFVCQSKIFDDYSDAIAYTSKNHQFKLQLGTVVVQPRPVSPEVTK